MGKRSIVLIALVLGALAALTVPGESQAPLKIGVIQPLSGPVAASGNYIRMGAEIARDWINARGGIAGRKVDLLIEDNKCDPKEAASTAENLIVRDKVPVIMGAWGSSITLVMKQAQEQRLGRKIVTTGGSSSPTQLIKQAGAAAEGSYHIVFFMPWFPEAMPDGKLAKAFVDEWAKRGHPFEGLTEGFRGHDGIATIAEAIRIAGKDEPKAVRDALWKVSLMGVNGPIKFEKDGPAGKESGQSQPSIFIVQIRDGKVALPDFLAKK